MHIAIYFDLKYEMLVVLNVSLFKYLHKYVVFLTFCSLIKIAEWKTRWEEF